MLPPHGSIAAAISSVFVCVTPFTRSSHVLPLAFTITDKPPRPLTRYHLATRIFKYYHPICYTIPDNLISITIYFLLHYNSIRTFTAPPTKSRYTPRWSGKNKPNYQLAFKTFSPRLNIRTKPL